MSIRSSKLSNKSGSSMQPKQSLGIKLTPEFVLMKTRQQLHHIKKINLWGQELRDVSMLQNATNLEIIALTVNNIDTLKDFQGLQNLQELYLRRNQIPADLNELHYLNGLPNLRVLNLAENPISSELGGIPNYRLAVLKHIPQLEKLDDVAVNRTEVAQAQKLDLDKVYQQMNELAIVLETESNISQQNDLKEISEIKYSGDSKTKSKQKQFLTRTSDLGPINKSLHAKHSKKSKAPPMRSSKKFKKEVPNDVFKPKNRCLNRTPPQNREKEAASTLSSDNNGKEFGYHSKEKNLNRSNNDQHGVKWMFGVHQSQSQLQVSSMHNSMTRQSSTGKFLMHPKPIKTHRNQLNHRQNRIQTNDHYVPQQQAHSVSAQYRVNNINTGSQSRTRYSHNTNTQQVYNTAQHQHFEAPSLLKKKDNGGGAKKRNENILCAIVALMSELDKKGLEFVQQDATKKIAKMSVQSLEHSAQFGVSPIKPRVHHHSSKRAMWKPEPMVSPQQVANFVDSGSSSSNDNSQQSLERVMSELEFNTNSDMEGIDEHPRGAIANKRQGYNYRD